jgi:branched-chain amino acid aminotransferase
MNNDFFIFFNNKFLKTNDPMTNIPWNDRGFTLGDGVFETIRIKEGKPLYLKDHVERLKKNAQLISLPFIYSLEAINKILCELLTINQLAHKNAYARITFTRGISERGLNIPTVQHPTLIITALAFQYKIAEDYTLKISKNIIKNEFSITSRIKSTSYLDYILARHEAVSLGCHDALLLNTQGYVVESSAANIFFRFDNRIITPPEKDGILPGIMRKNLLPVIESMGFTLIEKSLTPEEISTATEIFLTNALMPIQPVSKVKDLWEPTHQNTSVAYQLLESL